MQLVIDLINCTGQLDNVDSVRSFLLQTNLRYLKMKKLHEPVMAYVHSEDSPELNGVTGFMLIETSHIAIHTFSEKREVHFDCFSCRDFPLSPVMDYLLEIFGGKIDNQYILVRG